ncbi:MAG TPA: hypothetical protein VGP47_10520 [Parachlamydiaceae bacterium]|nr:hypothetical protein [Parachlamydiaceae bacterium]
MTTIQDNSICINTEDLYKSSSILATDHPHLGKKDPMSWLPSKIFLSYDVENGWNIKSLNVLQLCLRKVLGYYQDTHLEKIHYQWMEFKVKHNGLINEKLDQRIQEITQKKFNIVLGNSSISDAKVFFFAENHSDKTFKKSTAQLIEKYYSPGDLILVEGVIAGKVSNNHALLKYFPKKDKISYQIQGWEPKNLEELHPPIIREYMKVDNYYTVISEILEKKEALTSDDLKSLEENLNNYLSLISKFVSIFKAENDLQLQKGFKAAPKLLIMLKESNLKNEIFLCFIVLYLKNPFKKYDFRKLITKGQDFNIILNGVKERNVQLCKEINRKSAKDRKVFVVSGFGHLFKIPFANTSDTVFEIKKTLASHPHVIFLKNNLINYLLIYLFNREHKVIAQ